MKDRIKEMARIQNILEHAGIASKKAIRISVDCSDGEFTPCMPRLKYDRPGERSCFYLRCTTCGKKYRYNQRARMIAHMYDKHPDIKFGKAQ